ncbi:MAG: bifunctional 4-hydroxy-2-oxoglutarate aldolase/2-dehydro-3-deoxy-phosphogluconate aldolase [Spirochaetales bacterium]|nr:bifunctional 4-hydroxy-2-oxoglutarate aldolase/2-dehydro-3-deoxy-phosphogluconate aldolase [Spirochaetales bacterium]
MSLLIIGIARGISLEDLIPAFEASLQGGIRDLEITMNTPAAVDLIHQARQHFEGRARIGAGTVCNRADLDLALEAGAQFVVSPLTDPSLIRACVDQGIPVFPGAFTPTEVYTAWQAGATQVKVFPLGSLEGPSYLKELKGPFPQIPLLACGGVTVENVTSYRQAGADGLAIGSKLFNPRWLADKTYSLITQAARSFSAVSSG